MPSEIFRTKSIMGTTDKAWRIVPAAVMAAERTRRIVPVAEGNFELT
jgi:hypothetical protein